MALRHTHAHASPMRVSIAARSLRNLRPAHSYPNWIRIRMITPHTTNRSFTLPHGSTRHPPTCSSSQTHAQQPQLDLIWRGPVSSPIAWEHTHARAYTFSFSRPFDVRVIIRPHHARGSETGAAPCRTTSGGPSAGRAERIGTVIVIACASSIDERARELGRDGATKHTHTHAVRLTCVITDTLQSRAIPCTELMSSRRGRSGIYKKTDTLRLLTI